MKSRIIRPNVHRKLELPDQAGTPDKSGDTSLFAIVGNTFRQRGTVGASAPDHLPAIHVYRSVTRIHAPNVRTQRTTVAVRIHVSVVKIVGSMQIATEFRIVSVRRKHQGSATTPASHELGREQFLFFARLAVLPQKIAKSSYVFFDPEVSDVTAVAGKDLGLRQRRARTFFIVITQK